MWGSVGGRQRTGTPETLHYTLSSYCASAPDVHEAGTALPSCQWKDCATWRFRAFLGCSARTRQSAVMPML